jgi:hypothetical protein
MQVILRDGRFCAVGKGFDSGVVLVRHMQGDVYLEELDRIWHAIVSLWKFDGYGRCGADRVGLTYNTICRPTPPSTFRLLGSEEWPRTYLPKVSVSVIPYRLWSLAAQL